jgi:hypothetical protein
MQTFQHTPTANAIQAPSPEMGMANLVDKAVSPSDYQEPLDSDDQEPKVRTIGNRNRPQTRRIAGLESLLTMLTNNPVGLLLTRTASARLLSALGCAVAARLATWQVQESQVLARD